MGRSKAKIVVEFAPTKFWGGKGKARMFPFSSPTHQTPTDTCLGEMSHLAVVGLGIRRLAHIGNEFGSITTQNTAVNMCSCLHHYGH